MRAIAERSVYKEGIKMRQQHQMQRNYIVAKRANGTIFDFLIWRSLVIRGTLWTRLVAAIISSAGSPVKSSFLIDRQISRLIGHI